MKNIIEDDLRDIAIQVVDILIEKGYVPDCTDTDDPTEFEVQDIIVEGLKERLPKEPSHPWILVPDDQGDILKEGKHTMHPRQFK